MSPTRPPFVSHDRWEFVRWRKESYWKLIAVWENSRSLYPICPSTPADHPLTARMTMSDRIDQCGRMRWSHVLRILVHLDWQFCNSSKFWSSRPMLVDRRWRTTDWSRMIRETVGSSPFASRPTTLGKMGATHECVPSVSSFCPSINLSGVRTSSLVPGFNVFTLCGHAAMSERSDSLVSNVSLCVVISLSHSAQSDQSALHVRCKIRFHSNRCNRRHHAWNEVEIHRWLKNESVTSVYTDDEYERVLFTSIRHRNIRIIDVRRFDRIRKFLLLVFIDHPGMSKDDLLGEIKVTMARRSS